MESKKRRKTRFGKFPEWDWPDLIVDAFALLIRLVIRGIRAIFD